ncbi:lipopolysaccharide heptosyltransferase I [Campylobacter volucris]|uniref:Lipopolysaccharide heptosyltransferase 1 n=1 Tax=Campylobacter volucris TaxID=1031542 RepID=A0AAE5YH97_9BACT|nr:lipopolysaccharide heptosyltransferase I [Campylobacter volucris]AJC94525.1 heptosyltransferase I [Campylobacter volucris LMG 24379]KAB0578163.1 lipopolysaccharide heptosyltransferase I [Campylobacter volucris]QBL13123.1 lipopolysaccharide heptosyltransferase I [Campylobacter volucris]QEL08742.1 heptosyltransferase I [Campylobacter volucris]TXK71394.1 lipopolysaccharide heptosyltransferase I [Campylobacter volucris]
MKIGLVKLSALGDIIHAAIVLQFIKKHIPKAKIDWFVDKRFAGLLQDHSMINEVYALPLKERKIKECFSILLEARQNKYDVVIDLQGLIKSALVSRILCSNTFGFDQDSIKESFASNFYTHKFACNYEENIIIRNLSLVAYVLNEHFDNEDIRLKQSCFDINDDLKEELEQTLYLKETTPNILIHVGSSMPNKIYPKERLTLLCRMLLEHFANARILLGWGSVKEFNFAKEIVINLKHLKIDLAPKLSLSELCALTKSMDLIIGNDSGPTHLAFALNKPSISIFGATPSQRNTYETTINKTINAGKKILSSKHIDKSDFCIQNIDENDIFALACELLEKK